MRTLYLWRHAKSSWDHAGLDDFDRPLNDRGLRDAPLMAGLFRDRQEGLDLIVTSPAARTRATAEAMLQVLSAGTPKLLTDERIYLAPLKELFALVSALPPGAERVMLVGHNPGISDLCSSLSGADTGDLPTAAMVRIDLPVDQWDEVVSGTGHLAWYDHPKRHRPAH